MKKAFTLAEVLITLGIIGVIAALTIPNVVSNYRKKVAETRLAKFYTVINQAIKRSEVDNGPTKYWDSMTREAIEDENGEATGYYKSNAMTWYNKYLKPYMNVQKVEQTANIEDNIQIYFTDGSMLLLSSWSWIFYPEAKNFRDGEREDNSLQDRRREDSGLKYFTFMYKPEQGGVFPWQATFPGMVTDDTIKNDNTCGCKAQMVTNERAYCTLMIARNGWKIPDDYPLKF